VNLTFLNGAFLFAALAALLPLVIHLISRRRVTTVDFSSLRFLKELERKRIRRVRLRQILLLIVRSLIILAVALALSRPTLKGTLGEGGGHARTSIAVVIDNSASMSRTEGGGTLFSEAVDSAVEISGLLDEGDQAFLVTAGSPATSVLTGGTFSPDVVIQALDDEEVAPVSTDYSSAVELGSELLAGARNLNRELYLVGDMQRTGWKESPGAPAGTREERSEQEQPDAPRAYVLSLSGPTANLSISSARIERRHGAATGGFSVSARVTNHGARAAEALVRLFVDGEQVGQTGVDVAAGSTETARFAVAVDDEVWHRGRVELPPDAVDIDNVCYFVTPAARRTEVLVVRPEGGQEDATGLDDADYVYRALDPTSSGDRFAVSIVGADELSRQDPRRFAVVVLADVGRLDTDATTWLERRLENGGGVLLVLGNRTDVRFWNAGFMPQLVGGEIVAPVERRDGVRLAPASQGHPMLGGLVFGERLIDDISVRRAFIVRVQGAEVVLEMPGLGPALFLTEPRIGGEVGVLTTGLDPSWNDLPKSGFVVPLMHRLIERLSRSSAGVPVSLVGEDLTVPLPGPPSERIDVETPGGSTVAAELPPGGAQAAVLEAADEPGIYRFSESGRTVALGAVNVDPRESDLSRASDDELQERLSPMAVTFLDRSSSLADEVLESRYGRELWRVMLYVALALVAVEMFLARPRLVQGRTEE
jgi:hypothetical protein